MARKSALEMIETFDRLMKGFDRLQFELDRASRRDAEEDGPAPGKCVSWRRFSGPRPWDVNKPLMVYVCPCGRLNLDRNSSLVHALFLGCEKKKLPKKRLGYWVSERVWYAPWTWRRGYWKVRFYVDPLEALADAEIG